MVCMLIDNFDAYQCMDYLYIDVDDDHSPGDQEKIEQAIKGLHDKSDYCTAADCQGY